MNDLKKRPHDPSRVSLAEDWEIQYWLKEFGVCEQELRDAVVKAGHGTQAVWHHLRKKR